jgi:hypothetical protein
VTRLRIDRLHDEHARLRQQWRRRADDHLDALRDPPRAARGDGTDFRRRACKTPIPVQSLIEL